MSGSSLLPLAERRALGAVRRPEVETCPACDGPANVKCGSWRCARSEPLALTDSRLTCGARGTVMPDGRLAIKTGSALKGES